MPAGLARLEVIFDVDADGLLHVAAKELTTGIEQRVEVKPSYGLDDEQMEQMLLDSLDHGEADLEARRLAENRVEGSRILLATKKALSTDAALLEDGEGDRIRAAVAELDRAIEGKNASVIHTKIELLDEATHGWAGRRMDAAIARAIEGRNVADVETSVEKAKGVEGRLAEEGH